MASGRHQCSICMDSFKNPKLISCHHSFCYKCLDDYIQVNLRNGRFDCPICRASVELPMSGVSGFQSNVYIEQTDTSEKLYCDLCGPKIVSCSICLDCEENLCQSCCHAHKKSKVSRHHKICDTEREELKTVEDQHSQLNKVLDKEVAKVKARKQTVYQDLRQENAVFIRDMQDDFKMCSNANDNAHNLVDHGTVSDIIKKNPDLEQLISAVISKTDKTPNTRLERKLFSPVEIKPGESISLVGMMLDSTKISQEGRKKKEREEREKKERDERERKKRKVLDPVEHQIIYSKAADHTPQIRALPAGKKYHVYFCYPYYGMQWVKTTVERLEKRHGLVCCEHDRDNTARTPLLQFAANNIKYAYKTVAVLTNEAVQSEFVLCEIQMALKQGYNEMRKCVVPVLLENCDVPEFLSTLSYVDASDPNMRNIWWPNLLMELETDVDMTYLRDHHPMSKLVIEDPLAPLPHTNTDNIVKHMYIDKRGVSSELANELANSLKITERYAEFSIWLGTDLAKQNIVFVCLYRGEMHTTMTSYMGIDIYYKDTETPSRPFDPPHQMPSDSETSLGTKDAKLLQEAISIHDLSLFKKHSNLEAITGSSFMLSKSRGYIQCPSIVLYCRVKGIAPIGEVAFPTTLTTCEESRKVFIDVREGYLRQGMFQQSRFRSTDWHDKLRMGISIGVQGGNQGTLGPFVKINSTDVGFLTCSHVIVPDPRDISALQQSVGQKVFQPADGETHSSLQKSSDDRCCGEVSKLVFNQQICDPLNDLSKTVGVDAALITSKCRRHVDFRSFPFIPDRGLKNAGFDPASPPLYGHGAIKYPLKFEDMQGVRVIKYGAATGLTKGTLLLDGTMVKVHDATLRLPVNKEQVIMMGQYVVERQGENHFFRLGDSGAGVFTVNKENKLTCIGLAIGYLDDWQTVVTPIEYVLKALGLRLDAMEFEEDMKT